MFGLVWLICDQFDLISDQISAERKPKALERTEDDYLIRGKPNQILRWTLTSIMIIALFVRIFHFASGYSLVTYLCGLFFFGYLYEYVFNDNTSFDEYLASDWACIHHMTPDGRYSHDEPRISALLKHTLSPQEYNSLVLRILEFKFWFKSSKIVLLATVLSYITFLNCSYFGPKVLLWLINAYAPLFLYTVVIKKCCADGNPDDDADESNIDAQLLV